MPHDTVLDPKTQRALRVATLAFVALHVWHATGQAGGGWRGRYGGPLGAIKEFFLLSADDPVLSAGLSDFAVVAAVFGATVVQELPPSLRGSRRLKLWFAIYSVFPGLGALLYLVWLGPAARVTGR